MEIDVLSLVKVLGALGGVGTLMGAGLAMANQIFAVKIDPRIEQVTEALPGINCGACGFAGCSSYAEAVVENPDMAVNLCAPGGASSAGKIAEITGKTAGTGQKMVALLRCVQDESMGAPEKYIYDGIKDCSAVETLQKGNLTCPFACIGFGNCAEVCPVNAITMEKGRPRIDPDKCISCGICVKTCPRNVLVLAPYPGRVQVYCRNTKPPKLRRKICPSACIGCSICRKACPYDAIEMMDMVAVIHHEKCPPDCPRPCVEKCPTSAILAR